MKNIFGIRFARFPSHRAQCNSAIIAKIKSCVSCSVKQQPRETLNGCIETLKSERDRSIMIMVVDGFKLIRIESFNEYGNVRIAVCRSVINSLEEGVSHPRGTKGLQVVTKPMLALVVHLIAGITLLPFPFHFTRQSINGEIHWLTRSYNCGTTRGNCENRAATLPYRRKIFPSEMKIPFFVEEFCLCG